MNNELTTHKRKKVTPTVKQRRLARLMSDTLTGKIKPTTSAELVKAAGYSDSMAETSPNQALETPGTKEALRELGFTTENAKNVVTRILESEDSKDENKLRAADMIFKVHGEYASDKIAKENNANPVIFAKIEQHIYNFESELKKALGYENTRVIQPSEREDN